MNYFNTGRRINIHPNITGEFAGAAADIETLQFRGSHQMHVLRLRTY